MFRSYNVLIIAILAGAFVGAYKKGILKLPENKLGVLQIQNHTNEDSSIIGSVKKTSSRLINKINTRK